MLYDQLSISLTISTNFAVRSTTFVSSSALARAKIAQAEQIAGRGVNKQVVAQGWHSHDSGTSWERH